MSGDGSSETGGGGVAVAEAPRLHGGGTVESFQPPAAPNLPPVTQEIAAGQREAQDTADQIAREQQVQAVAPTTTAEYQAANAPTVEPPKGSFFSFFGKLFKKSS